MGHYHRLVESPFSPVYTAIDKYKTATTSYLYIHILYPLSKILAWETKQMQISSLNVGQTATLVFSGGHHNYYFNLFYSGWCLNANCNENCGFISAHDVDGACAHKEARWNDIIILVSASCSVSSVMTKCTCCTLRAPRPRCAQRRRR